MSATLLTFAPGFTCKFNCKAPSLNFIGTLEGGTTGVGRVTEGNFDLLALEEDMSLTTATIPIP